MKLAVSYDDKGTILTMFDPEKLKGKEFTLQYVPAKGEKHQVFDVPQDLEKVAFTELHKVAKVNVASGTPKLERFM